MGEIEVKVCPKCKQEKDKNKDFGVRRHNKTQSWCNDCKKELRNSDRSKELAWVVKLRNQYNITSEFYNAMLEAQDFGCAICGRPQEDNKNSQRLSVDHDHSCCDGDKSCGRCVRGLLCAYCNTGLGFFFDDIDLLELASEYLLKTVIVISEEEVD